MRQRGRKAVTGRRIRVDSRRRRQPVGHGEGFLLATLLQSVLCAMMLALAFAASQYWGLTGIKSVIFHAYEDIILLLCGLYGAAQLARTCLEAKEN